MQPKPTGPGIEASAVTERIRLLGGAMRSLHDCGHPDMALEVEHERDRLCGKLAGIPSPAEVTIPQMADLLDATLKALGATEAALLIEHVEWVKATLTGVLDGTQDVPFATSFLRAQIRRLSPAAEITPPPGHDGTV